MYKHCASVWYRGAIFVLQKLMVLLKSVWKNAFTYIAFSEFSSTQTIIDPKTVLEPEKNSREKKISC